MTFRLKLGIIYKFCRGGGTADTHASKACDRKIIRVQVPSPAQRLTFGFNSGNVKLIGMDKKKEIRWSADLAYVVGLITTDGNLSKDGRHINLVSKDINQLQNFAKILELKNRISPHRSSSKITNSYHIQFSNVLLYRFLLKIGLTPHKTKTLGVIKIPSKYFIDFLRGHLDGDGSIFTYQDQYNTYKGVQYTNLRIYTSFISVSKKHLEWLRINIIKNLQVKGSFNYDQKDKNHLPIWRIKFSKKESLKLIKLLYYDRGLPSLERKRLLAQRILDLAAQEKRKVYTKIPYSKDI